MKCCPRCASVLLLTLALLALASSYALARTIYVSTGGDDGNDGLTWDTAKKTVQAGLNTSSSGDEVWVAQGTYVERITLTSGVALYGGFTGAETSREERSLDPSLTVLDGNGEGSVVTSPFGADTTTRIDGFTIQGGTGTLIGSYRYGGGVYCFASSPTVANNRFVSNRADYGGAIHCSYSSAEIIGNSIASNSATLSGGGVYCTVSSPTIRDNDLSSNSAASGAGISCTTSSAPTISGNRITGNSASTSPAKGGGIYCSSSSPPVIGNTISGNQASYGGGICCENSSNPEISDNIISDNEATSEGGGVYCDHSSPALRANVIARNISKFEGGGIVCFWSGSSVSNNRIMLNSAPFGGGMRMVYSRYARVVNNVLASNTGYGVSIFSSSMTIADNVFVGNAGGIESTYSAPWIVNNTFFGNAGAGINCESSSSANIVNNIVAFGATGIYKDATSNPILKNNCIYGNVSGNYNGFPTDPTGTNGNISSDPLLVAMEYGGLHIALTSPCVDAGDDSAVRPAWVDIDGQPRTQGTHVDIGADESDGSVPSFDPPVIIRVSPEGNDANDGASWASAKRTVQAALDRAAADGGEVWVKDGIYYECATIMPFTHLYGGFAGNETEKGQRNWTSNATVLDGAQEGSVITMVGTSSVDGFTIRGGIGTIDPVMQHRYGGGIYSTGYAYKGWIWSLDSRGYPHLRIANNTITQNTAESLGGGIHCTDSFLSITGNTISGNSSNQCSAVSAYYDCTVWMADNLVSGNVATYGETIAVRGSATICGNAITNNTGTYVAAISCSGPNVVISRNLIAFNSGGAIWCHSVPSSGRICNNRFIANSNGSTIRCSSSSPTIANNSFAGNTQANGFGATIYWDHDSSPMVVNNTITGDVARERAAIFCGQGNGTLIANNVIAFCGAGIYASIFSPPDLRNNCVYGNVQNYLYFPDQSGKNGNISVDPEFVSPKWGNMHLAPDSPCVDAGDDSAVAGDWVDMDGQARVSGEHVDIGADEFDGTLYPDGPYAVIHVSPDGSDENDGASWEHAKRTLQRAIDDACLQGADVWARAGVYNECVTLHPFAHLYGGFNGTESDISQRDWRANATVIDGQSRATVVSVLGGHTWTTIDGFTIQNGYGGTTVSGEPLGGGIHCYGASPAIANNVILGNTAGVGGGIYCEYGGPTISRNVITSNAASEGGGLYLKASSSIVAHNLVENNAAATGGGISAYDLSGEIVSNVIARNVGRSGPGGVMCGGAARISNNVVIGNASTSGVGGMAVYGTGGAWNNLVVDNSSTSGTGGLGAYGSGPFSNNTIARNSSVSGVGGVYCESTTSLVNNIVAFNSSGVRKPYGNPTLRHNCVFGNTAYNYSGFPSDPTGTNGNISADPLFRNLVGGDYRLLPDSPCIDAGMNEGAPETDLDGNPRPVDGDCDGTAVTDIGAYEYQPIRVTVDVLPGQRDNIVRLQTRQVVVAVLSTPLFDARWIDPLSVVFGPGRASEVHGKGHWEDVNSDGLTDLLLHFSLSASGISVGDTSVPLYGRLLNRERIVGWDAIRVVER